MTLPVKLLFSLDDVVSLQELRALIFEGIGKALAWDDHCKSYEGTLQIQLPNYFEGREGQSWVELRLGCYVLGPTRHYEWRADSLGEAIRMARTDVESWIADLAEHQAEDAADRGLRR